MVRGLKAPQYVVLKDKEIMNWLEAWLSGFKVQYCEGKKDTGD